ncbi:hypothetical protein GOBAR_DD05553 [Gossypium barbadense]|nr:hypothetical protein GOBAR_DD05553 [Gossypium barbadense]
MELVDDDNVETMVVLYCVNRRHQNALIQLFAKLADVEPIEDSTPLGEEHGVQDPCTMIPIAYVDSRSTIHEVDIDLNVALASENLNMGPRLQIHLVVFETDVDGDDEYDNSDPCDHEIVDYSDPDLDEVPNDIDDEGANNDRNVNTSSVGNLIRHIMIYNDPGAHMSLIDPDAVHAVDFSKL